MDETTGKSRGVSRRGFLGGATLGWMALFAAGLWGHARATGPLPAHALRPPGALPEKDFLAACIRCGLCVRDCPYDTLRLAAFAAGDGPNGTPWFRAREVACEMCEEIPCVKACPTGALDHGLTDITRARMGLAVVIDHETCLNYLGLRCDICYRVCPVLDKAITLEMLPNPRTGHHGLFLPTVHSDACTGCGKCEKACPLPAAAIRVLPIDLAKGLLGEHYRLGWVEKEKAGSSLIPQQYQMPVRGMESTTQPGLPAPGEYFQPRVTPLDEPSPSESLWPSGKQP